MKVTHSTHLPLVTPSHDLLADIAYVTPPHTLLMPKQHTCFHLQVPVPLGRPCRPSWSLPLLRDPRSVLGAVLAPAFHLVLGFVGLTDGT